MCYILSAPWTNGLAPLRWIRAGHVKLFSLWIYPACPDGRHAINKCHWASFMLRPHTDWARFGSPPWGVCCFSVSISLLLDIAWNYILSDKMYISSADVEGCSDSVFCWSGQSTIKSHLSLLRGRSTKSPRSRRAEPSQYAVMNSWEVMSCLGKPSRPLNSYLNFMLDVKQETHGPSEGTK